MPIKNIVLFHVFNIIFMFSVFDALSVLRAKYSGWQAFFSIA